MVLGASYVPRVSRGHAEPALYLIGILACALALLAWMLWASYHAENTAAG